MRLIVACPTCKRQYDAASRQPGDHFHCACGEDLVVRAPKGHDASVVRCSACGGPRTDDDRSCAHCGATLTLHERDLHTVCPGCLARISDRASFCHHCGLSIVPEAIAGATTTLGCPVCGDGVHLSSRQFATSEHTMAECKRCAGLWLDKAVLATLEARAREEQPTDEVGTVAAVSERPLARQQGPLYRPCPVCRKLMNRANYGRRSGVIIDRCRPHGVWFDDDELTRALRWIREGGARASALRDDEEQRQRERLARVNRPPPISFEPGTPVGGGWSSFVGALVGLGARFLD